MNRNLIIFFVLLVMIGIVWGLFFNQKKILGDSWEYYKRTFISSDGRVVDFNRNNVTTSEGQAYALVRAVLIDDPDEFLKVYLWTRKNLKRDNDNLYSWLWGKRVDGNWGVIDGNSASDADIDIAFALIMASKVWGNASYLDDAKKIIADIWALETKDINGMRVLASGVEQGREKYVMINPSYFAPYAFRIFKLFDGHDWDKVIDSSYGLLDKVCGMTKTGLPPDWFYIDSRTGSVYMYKDSSKSDFSYDAIRVFIRLYIDNKFFKEKKSEAILNNVMFLIDRWKENKNNLFITQFNKDSGALVNYENIESIALLIPVINIKNQRLAHNLKSKVDKYYNKAGYWKDSKNYYSQNLTWLGMWTYLNEKESENIVRKIYSK